MKITIDTSRTLPKMMDFTVGRLKLTTYLGSPWIGFEFMRRMLFITLFGRRFEFRWLDKEKI